MSGRTLNSVCMGSKYSRQGIVVVARSMHVRQSCEARAVLHAGGHTLCAEKIEYILGALMLQA